MKKVNLILVLSIMCFISLFTQCSTLNHTIDSIEYAHNLYWNETKAIIVVECKGKYIYCVSPTGTRYYRVKDEFNRIHTDTIILLENKWVYEETKFIKYLPVRKD